LKTLLQENQNSLFKAFGNFNLILTRGWRALRGQ